MSVEYDPTPNVPDRWLFGDEVLPVTSAGLLLTSGPLNSKPYFYFVEQQDVEVNRMHPWGIPAGKTEESESDVRQTLERELFEETGLQLPKEIERFLVLNSYRNGYTSEPTSAKLIYHTILPLELLRMSLGEYTVCEARSVEILKGYYFRNLPIFVSNNSYSSEIGRRALVPADRLFERSGVILPYYRWDIMHSIKAKLEGLRVI